MKYLKEMKDQATENNESLRRDVNDKLNAMTNKIDKAEVEAKKKEENNDLKMKGIIERLDSIENKFTNKDRTERDEDERKKQDTRTKEFKDSFGLVDKPVEKIREKTWSELVEQNCKEDEEKKRKEREEKTKHWSKKIFAKERDKRKDDSETERKTKSDAEIEEEVKKKVEVETLNEKLKLDNAALHDDADWSWDDSDKEWDGTAEHKEVRKKRKIERYRRRKTLESKVSKKAKHMIGLGPIRRASVNYFHGICADFEEAKLMAIDEFFSEYLQLDEEARQNFTILETSIAKSDDELIYITMQDFESIREIKSRVAEVQNDEIKMRNFIPPQFWNRYKFLSNFCADKRSANDNLKTMIRFNDNDIEVLFKYRNEENQYNTISLKEIEEEGGTIPKFDHSVNWVRRQDRPPKTPVRRVTEPVVPPSLRGSTLSKQVSISSSSSGNSLPLSKRKKTTHKDVNSMETEDCNTEGVSDKSL